MFEEREYEFRRVKWDGTFHQYAWGGGPMPPGLAEAIVRQACDEMAKHIFEERLFEIYAEESPTYARNVRISIVFMMGKRRPGVRYSAPNETVDVEAVEIKPLELPAGPITDAHGA